MPQKIMLAVHCKKQADTVELKAPLVEFVKGTYGPKVGRLDRLGWQVPWRRRRWTGGGSGGGGSAARGRSCLRAGWWRGEACPAKPDVSASTSLSFGDDSHPGRAWQLCGAALRRAVLTRVDRQPPLLLPRATPILLAALQAASDAAEDLEEVVQLRNDVVNQTGPLSMQADNLAKYHRVLMCAPAPWLPADCRLHCRWHATAAIVPPVLLHAFLSAAVGAHLCRRCSGSLLPCRACCPAPALPCPAG